MTRKPKQWPEHDFQPDEVLYEDDYIIAVNKPPGLPSQPTRDPNRDNVKTALQRYLSQRDGETPYLAVHHRLDLDTTGVMVLARHRKANKGMTNVFRERLAQKTYLALSVPRPREPQKTPKTQADDHWVVSNHLKVQKSGKRRKQHVVHAGGDYAETRFRVLVTGEAAWLIEANPKTGRKHQIRVHLAHQGAPILGDSFYGGPETVSRMSIPRMMLHALVLELPHPVNGQRISIQAPLPADFADVCTRLLGTVPDLPQ